MKSLVAFLLLAHFLPSIARAAEIVPVTKDQQIGALIVGMKLPEAFGKDVTSGLTNSILVRISILAGSKVIVQKAVDVSIKYDLWQETFKLTMVVDGSVNSGLTYASLQDITVFLANLRLPSLFAVSSITGLRDLTLRADMLMNPIERERIEKIRQWVSRNDTYTSADTEGFGSGKRVATPRSNALFNKIFEQYSRSNVVAAWSETVTSKPFQVEDLRDER